MFGEFFLVQPIFGRDENEHLICVHQFIHVQHASLKGKPIVAMALALMALKMLQTYETCELLHVTLRTVAVGGHGEFIQGQVQGYRNPRGPPPPNAHPPQQLL